MEGVRNIEHLMGLKGTIGYNLINAFIGLNFSMVLKIGATILSPNKIFKEIDKMLYVRIIYPIHHSTWVANVVPVRKKNGEKRICVDFRNLNQASLKDNFSLPNMDHLLQTIAGSEMMSTLDGFSRYNQIQVDEADQFKTALTTPWDTFAYNRMSCGLLNVGISF
jgi:hypothetical protein